MRLLEESEELSDNRRLLRLVLLSDGKSVKLLLNTIDLRASGGRFAKMLLWLWLDWEEVFAPSVNLAPRVIVDGMLIY